MIEAEDWVEYLLELFFVFVVLGFFLFLFCLFVKLFLFLFLVTVFALAIFLQKNQVDCSKCLLHIHDTISLNY